jgi:hypothetical protein
VIGILVLAVSSFPLLRDFGLITALNVGVALLSALVALPPLLLWADERGWLYRPSAAPPMPTIADAEAPAGAEAPTGAVTPSETAAVDKPAAREATPTDP